MDLKTFADKFSISMRKARAMERAGALNLNGKPLEAAEPPEAMERAKAVALIRRSLARKQDLGSYHLAALIDDLDMYSDLGVYRRRAYEQVQALGNAEAEASRDMAYLIDRAAGGDDEALANLATWIKATVPQGGCYHAYLAVRILLGVQGAGRDQIAPLINPAFSQVRKFPALDGWYSKQGGKIIYQNPLDL